MKILTVLGDSLGTVRPEENIATRDLYSYKIQEALKGGVYIVNHSLPNNTAERENGLDAYIYHIAAANSAYFILQLGICDCSPRVMTKARKDFVKKLSVTPGFRRFANWYIRHLSHKRRQITEKKLIAYTTPSQFGAHLTSVVQKIRDTNPVERIYLLNIAYPGKHLTSRSHGVLSQIETFNSVLTELAGRNPDLIRIIDVFGMTRGTPSLILTDGHHISPAAHSLIAQEIVGDLTRLLVPRASSLATEKRV